MIKRKTYRFRKGDIIDVEEFHDGRYGAPGKKRVDKAKPTEEQMRMVNALNKARRCRQRLLMYFHPGDIFATWTYEEKNRYEVFWIRNIERGTKGAWHIHLIINEIGDTAGIIQRAWKKGGTWSIEIKNSKHYDEDFTKLANYMTKDEYTTEEKKDGSRSKPRLREASYSTSRNMPLPKPKVDKLCYWKKEPKPKKGYYIAKIHEGINPVTGYLYRRYTMIRLKGLARGGGRSVT